MITTETVFCDARCDELFSALLNFQKTPLQHEATVWSVSLIQTRKSAKIHVVSGMWVIEKSREW